MTEEQNNGRRPWGWIFEQTKIGKYLIGGGELSDDSDSENKAINFIIATAILEYLDTLSPRIMSKMFILWARGKDVSQLWTSCIKEKDKLNEEENRSLENKLWCKDVDEWLMRYDDEVAKKWRKRILETRLNLIYRNLNNMFTAWVYGRVCCPILYRSNYLKGWINRKASERIDRQNEAFGAFYQFIYELLNNNQDNIELHIGDRRLLDEIQINFRNYNTFESVFINMSFTIKDRISKILNISRPSIRVSFNKLKRDITGNNIPIINFTLRGILDKLENKNGKKRNTIELSEVIAEVTKIGDETIKNQIKELLDRLEEKYSKVIELPINDENINNEVKNVSAIESHVDEIQQKEDQVLFHNAYKDVDNEENRAIRIFAYWLKVNIIDNKLATQRAIVNAFNMIYENDVSLSRLLAEGQDIMDGKRIKQDIQDKNFV